MPVASRQRKSLNNIRTNSDRVDMSASSYKAYLRVGALEMEKARRMKEKQQLEERLHAINVRCRELDAEKKRILSAIGQGQMTVAPEKQGIGTVIPKNTMSTKDQERMVDEIKQVEEKLDTEELENVVQEKTEKELLAEVEAQMEKERLIKSKTERPAPSPTHQHSATAGFVIRY